MQKTRLGGFKTSLTAVYSCCPGNLSNHMFGLYTAVINIKVKVKSSCCVTSDDLHLPITHWLKTIIHVNFVDMFSIIFILKCTLSLYILQILLDYFVYFCNVWVNLLLYLAVLSIRVKFCNQFLNNFPTS